MFRRLLLIILGAVVGLSLGWLAAELVQRRGRQESVEAPRPDEKAAPSQTDESGAADRATTDQSK